MEKIFEEKIKFHVKQRTTRKVQNLVFSNFLRNIFIRAFIHVKHQFFKNSFFPSTIIEQNKLNSNIRNSETLNIFKSKTLKFIRPTANSIYGCHNSIGVKKLTRLQLRLSHLREHKFKHSLQNPLNPLCSDGKEVETTFRFLLPCPSYSDERLTLLSKIININPNILENTNSQITLFFYTEIHKKASPYQCGSKRCDLCLSEKVSIICADSDTLLNKRTELISKCYHGNKFLFAKVKK